MKKILLTFLFICTISLFVKYFFSSYDIKYVVNNHNVETVYKNNRLYFEIDNKYNFDIYMKSYFKKIMISKIEELETLDYECIYTIIEGVKTYPLCYKDDVQIDYNLVDDEVINKYKTNNDVVNNNSFEYYKNLNDSYVAVWNYKGYYVMNKKEYENIEIFKTDRYDNSLSFMKNEIIYMPDYNQEHTFNTLVTLDVKSKKINKIKLNYDIDYDSYLVGDYDDKMYIFDNKYSILYEFDYKKEKLVIKGSNTIGYTKFEDGKEVSCSKSEYKVDKIKYNDNKSIYNYYYEDDKLFKTISNNKDIKTLIQDKNITIINEYKNNLYYIYKDSFYKYSPYTNEKIFYFNELEFNKDNTIFVYSY